MKKIAATLLWNILFICFFNSKIIAQPFASAQGDHGIHWTYGLSWEQVKQKAKAENKFIFIDAYTTWCGPCKMMDKYVYTNDTVGDFFNEHFIAIKAQMDRTNKDDDNIQKWYNDAAIIEKLYTVRAYPSLIFLSPDARVLQKEEGYRPVQQFVMFGKEALKPGKTYDDPYTRYKVLVKEYEQGIKHYDSMPYMIKTAITLSDVDLARKLFKEDLDYCTGLNENIRYVKENIEIWSSFILKLDSKALQFFLEDGDKIDEVMNQKGYSRNVVDNCIQSRIVDSFFRMQKGETTTIAGVKVSNSEIMFGQLPVRRDGKIDPDYVEADWKMLERMIRKYFNRDYTTRNVLTARMRWYQQHQNMTKASRMYFTRTEKFPPSNFEFMTISSINQNAWQTFLYVNDKKLLKKATKWMTKIIQLMPDHDPYLDTYASLLYKLGQTDEAIKWEEKALSVTNPLNEEKKKTYKNVIEKMRNGEPTYLDQGALWKN